MIESPRQHALPPGNSLDTTRSGDSPPYVDAALAARARAGDVAAFESLVRRHLRPVYQLARHTLPDGTAPDKVVVDVFARAWRDLTHGLIPDRFGTWILTKTTQQCHENTTR